MANDYLNGPPENHQNGAASQGQTLANGLANRRILAFPAVAAASGDNL
jgi:hypothetical protein